MSFTDKDLARWKESVDTAGGRFCFTCEMPTSEVESLIARLEAAEVIAEDHASIYPNDKAVIEWLKSKGGGR